MLNITLHSPTTATRPVQHSMTNIPGVELVGPDFTCCCSDCVWAGRSVSSASHNPLRATSFLTGCGNVSLSSSWTLCYICMTNKYPFFAESSPPHSKHELWKQLSSRSAQWSLTPGNLPQAPCGFNHCQSFSLMHFGRLKRTRVTAPSCAASYLFSEPKDKKQQTCTLNWFLWI